MRVAVVGAGIMGCASAWALARDGHDVLLLEQFRVGHTRGSSHGRSRIFRIAYPEPEWVRLAAESMRLWRELESESATKLLELHGLLELVADPALSSRDGLDAAGAQYELLTDVEARDRWPVGVPHGWYALFQPEAGIVRADLAQQAFLDVARAHGARLQEDTRVADLSELEADIVVVTAGAWAPKLLPALPVQPTRETLAYFRREGPPGPSIGELNPKTRGHAMYSLRDPVHGLKAGHHHSGPAADPDEEGEPDAEVLERVAAWVARVHPDVDPTPVVAETCLYTNTDDERFIVERRDRIVICSACSGHGFKFAPAIGRRVAELAAG